MPAGLWSLDSDPDALESAAGSWRSLAASCATAAEGFAEAGASALAEWDGGAADEFTARRTAIVADLDSGSEHAQVAARALLTAAAVVRVAQLGLDLSWASVGHLPYRLVGGGAIEFQAADEAERATVAAAIAAAEGVRATLESHLATCSDALARATLGFAAIGLAWQLVGTGTVPLLSALPTNPDVGVLIVDGVAIVTTGDGDEVVEVVVDPATGDVLVTVSRRDDEHDPHPVATYRIPRGTDVTIRAGAGHDVVTLPATADVRFTVVGGDGEDRITGSGRADRILGSGGADEIDAGGGNDDVSGGAGADYVNGEDGLDWASGGADRDALYGLGGADRLSGGSGEDYLEGGEGRDRIVGGEGRDQLSGGRGADLLAGSGGDDIAYGGEGRDRVVGGAGTDTAYDDAPASSGSGPSESESRVTIEVSLQTDAISIAGSEEFRARVQADLDMLAGSPTGRAMLDSLQHELTADSDTLQIREYVPAGFRKHNNKASDGGDQDLVWYMPSNSTRDRPPMVGFYHELSHVYSYTHEITDRSSYTGLDTVDAPYAGLPDVEVVERQGTGLPIDHDRDPSTPEILDPRQPLTYTENGLRAELGVPARPHYRDDLDGDGLPDPQN